MGRAAPPRAHDDDRLRLPPAPTPQRGGAGGKAPPANRRPSRASPPPGTPSSAGCCGRRRRSDVRTADGGSADRRLSGACQSSARSRVGLVPWSCVGQRAPHRLPAQEGDFSKLAGRHAVAPLRPRRSGPCRGRAHVLLAPRPARLVAVFRASRGPARPGTIGFRKDRPCGARVAALFLCDGAPRVRWTRRCGEAAALRGSFPIPACASGMQLASMPRQRPGHVPPAEWIEAPRVVETSTDARTMRLARVDDRHARALRRHGPGRPRRRSDQERRHARYVRWLPHLWPAHGRVPGPRVFRPERGRRPVGRPLQPIKYGTENNVWPCTRAATRGGRGTAMRVGLTRTPRPFAQCCEWDGI